MVRSAEVTHNKDRQRYELVVNGEMAITAYRLSDGVYAFIHTEVPPELEGQGIGSRLVKGALEDVSRNGGKVEALCAFVRSYIEKHEEFQALLAD